MNARLALACALAVRRAAAREQGVALDRSGGAWAAALANYTATAKRERAKGSNGKYIVARPRGLLRPSRRAALWIVRGAGRGDAAAATWIICDVARMPALQKLSKTGFVSPSSVNAAPPRVYPSRRLRSPTTTASATASTSSFPH